MELTKAGTSVLKMDEIYQLLDIKYDMLTKDELAYAGDETKDEKGALVHKNGMKIKEIAGVAPRLLAVAIDKDHRTTVANALQLGGKGPEAYFSAQEASSVKNLISKIQTSYAAELADLRDELNQLRMELAKSGVTDDRKPYAGFYDVFHTDYPVHMNEVVATADQDMFVQNRIHLKEEDFDKFYVGDRILITTDLVEGDNGIVIATVKDKLNSKGITNTLELDSFTGFAIKKDKVHIYKSYGMNYKNTFSFGKFVDDKPGNKDIFTCLDDDNYRLRKKITAPRTGFATTFRINPSKANGTGKYFLSKIEIQVKKYGNPGALMCYVINADHVKDWVNPKQAQDDGFLIAQSKPLVVDEKDGEHIEEFEFMQNGTYPMLKNIDMGDKKDRFCMIIEALDADSTSNYYELLFLQHYDPNTNTFSDLQLNNDCYRYHQLDTGDLSKIVTGGTTALISNEEMKKCDMYYGVTLKACEEGQFIPYSEGIYTAQFKTNEPVKVNQARLTLRVAREGQYNVVQLNNEDGNVSANGKIIFKEDKNYRYDEQDKTETVSGFADDITNKYVAVGTNICKPESVIGEVLTPQEGFHTEIGDPVYPIGYTAKIVARNVRWDKTTESEVKSQAVSIPLKLVSIQPAVSPNEQAARKKQLADPNIEDMTRDRLMDENRISDRLVFEGELKGLDDSDGQAMKYNDFELQIDWKHTSSIVPVLRSFAGRIYDLTVSLNR